MAMLPTILLAGAVTQQWSMTHGAKAFAATIGPQCLTTPDASIAADGDRIAMTDTPDCVAEVREITQYWPLYTTTDTIITVTGTPEGLAAKRLALEARFGKSPNPRLRFLGSTQTCRCLVIAGKLSLDASKLVEGEAKPVLDRRAKLIAPHDPLSPDKPQQDLIWRETPTPSAADKPLVN